MTWILPEPDLLSVGDDARAPLTAALGVKENGEALSLNVAQLPHLAIAGTSGSGKSTLIRTILASLLMVSDPDDLRFVLVDVTDELEDLYGIPHLAVDPIDDVEDAADVFEALVEELARRYALLKENGVRNITEYNALGVETMPQILCVVDEFAEMMLSDEKKRIERAVSRLGIRGRKCGIHLILATQVPHATVLTPTIKANMAGRIALAVPSTVFSRVAIDEPGAEKLKGNGDALLRDGRSTALTHFQGSFVSRDDLRRVVDHWRDQMDEAPDPIFVYDTIETGAAATREHRPWRYGGALVIAAVIAAIAFLPNEIGVPGTPAGCPSGTQVDNSVLSRTCDESGGKISCVQWATGFTPDQRNQMLTLQYVDTVPDLGSWCPGATDPPGGDG